MANPKSRGRQPPDTLMKKIVTIILLMCLAGCSNAPSELRNLSPVEIQVVRDGHPVEGVSVALYAEGSQGLVGCNALTDRQGLAVLKTSVQSMVAKGVPPGGYKVVLTKEVVFPTDLADFEADQQFSESERSARQKQRDDFVNNNRIVPQALETPETTPLRLDVKLKEKCTLTVDLAKY